LVAVIAFPLYGFPVYRYVTLRLVGYVVTFTLVTLDLLRCTLFGVTRLRCGYVRVYLRLLRLLLRSHVYVVLLRCLIYVWLAVGCGWLRLDFTALLLLVTFTLCRLRAHVVTFVTRGCPVTFTHGYVYVLVVAGCTFIYALLRYVWFGSHPVVRCGRWFTLPFAVGLPVTFTVTLLDLYVSFDCCTLLRCVTFVGLRLRLFTLFGCRLLLPHYALLVAVYAFTLRLRFPRLRYAFTFYTLRLLRLVTVVPGCTRYTLRFVCCCLRLVGAFVTLLLRVTFAVTFAVVYVCLRLVAR